MKKPTLTEFLKLADALHKQVSFTGLIYAPLHSDFDYAIQQWQKNPTSQFWSRTGIRCFSALVEAMLFQFRRMAELLGPAFGVTFDTFDTEVISEQQTREVNGVPTVRPKYLQFPDSMKQSFRVLGKAVNCRITVNYGASGYSDLCRVFEIRNRLMHPKAPFDIQITAKDIDTANRAITWFNKTYTDVLNQCMAHTDALARTSGNS